MQAHSLSNRAASNSLSFLSEPSGLAHDAGNLLHALGLYCDLLECPGVLKTEHRHYAAELRLIADRSTRLLSHFAESSEPLSPRQKTGELLDRNFVRFCAEICAPSAFSIHIASDLLQVPVSEEVIERILLNLVRNAAEALEKQGHIFGEVNVSLRTDNEHFLLTVEDNGPGMEPAIAAQFVRPRLTAGEGGRGLGHRILRELAVSTGASFELHVRPGRGSRFCFRWKLTEESPGSRHPDARQKNSVSDTMAVAAFGGKRPTC